MPLSFLKFYWSDKLLARRTIEMYENVGTVFLSSLWTFPETKTYKLIQYLTELKIPVNESFQISPEPLKIFSEKSGKLVEIPIPSSHIGAKPIKCRLLSIRWRKRMEASKQSETTEKSNNLIIHCHGGGWVSQDSNYRE
jgi:hormone-sensitive lipase